jgi:hypothetical protein
MCYDKGENVQKVDSKPYVFSFSKNIYFKQDVGSRRAERSQNSRMQRRTKFQIERVRKDSVQTAIYGWTGE